MFDESPVHDNELPAYGNPFITEGYIYPHGTLAGGSGDVKGNGVLPNGDAEFETHADRPLDLPRLVRRQRREDHHGSVVVTHQLYDFGRTPGSAVLCTDGHELADIDVAIKRAITGGTGPYRAARRSEPDAARVEQDRRGQPASCSI